MQSIALSPVLFGALLRDAAARADEDMRLPEVHEQSEAVIGLTQPQQSVLLPFRLSAAADPPLLLPLTRLPINMTFTKEGLKPRGRLLRCSREERHHLFLSPGRSRRRSNPALQPSRRGGQHLPMLLSCKSSPRTFPGLRRELGKRAKGGETRRGGEMENEDAALCSS